MSEDKFPARLAGEPTALVDLVNTTTPGERDEILSRITAAAGSAGGRVTLANRALAPMILPDESDLQADEGVSLLVISEYETGEAARAAIALRERGPGQLPAGLSIRTWATRPAGRIESFIGHNLPRALAPPPRVRASPLPTTTAAARAAPLAAPLAAPPAVPPFRCSPKRCSPKRSAPATAVGWATCSALLAL